MPFKPMLACAVEDVTALPYPMIGSPKLDGIRCLRYEGRVLTRSLKPVPNRHITASLERWLPEGADGEIMVGETFQECTSGVMSIEGEPDFRYWMFDLIAERPYVERLSMLSPFDGQGPIEVVPTTRLENAEVLLAYEAEMLSCGFEGVCLRTPKGPYKYGRSTLREAYLLKLKRFQDAEAVVIGYEEQCRNTNPAETNELGHTKRAHTKDGREGKGVLGAFQVRTPEGVTFSVGTGFTDAQRAALWQDRDEQIGKTLKFKSQPYGVKEAPRLPVFLGFRDVWG